MTNQRTVPLNEMVSPFTHVGVVLVEYHSDGLVESRAREALDLGCAVAVVDNSGTYRGPGVVVTPQRNVGFGAACNAGARALPVDVDVLVFQNPDATVSSDGLGRLVTHVRGQWDGVAPALWTDRLVKYGFTQPSLVRGALLPLRELARAWVGRGSGGADAHRPPPREACESSVVRKEGRFGSAALLALRRPAFEQVGGFDERYFLYAEDLDLWRRLERAGFQVGFVPSVVATHIGASGSDASAARRCVFRWVGREVYAQIWQPSTTKYWRRVHRWGMVLLPGRDRIIQLVRQYYREGLDAVTINQRLQEGVQAVDDPLVIRVGWSRSRVRVDPGTRVLDLGSGAFPNPRADVLCERTPVRSHRRAVVDRPFVVADALALPFRNEAFGFVIASHLAEHVSNPTAFCEEVARVGKAGYLETPSPIFERVFPESNHLWRVSSRREGEVRFARNRRTGSWLERLGRWLYPYYYAGRGSHGEASETLRSTGYVGTKLALIVRAIANRSHLSVTTVKFGPRAPLRCEIDRDSQATAEEEAT